ncbi:hypothetical protein EYF80_059491 [Liparis tanakae]|uniref:Uncharacterized protein n=1 Tax=Liparis tanakae TaxID=230148 RepID=A0A4Z2EN42_9TELE|nr:hypothetical protein EYF80_059491 [Liparis tanakae]
MSTEAPGSQQLLLGFTRYFSGAVVRTCGDAGNSFTVIVECKGRERGMPRAQSDISTKIMRLFFSVSADPKLSSSAGLEGETQRESLHGERRDAVYKITSHFGQ